MQMIWGDLRYAIRVLSKAPGFTAVAATTLALGIGATTTLFSIVHGVVLNPLPYPRSEGLIAVYARTPGIDKGPVSYLNFLDWQRENRSFSSLALYRNQTYNLTGTTEGERLAGYMISAGFFSTLGVSPILGRDFSPSDDQVGAAPVAILGGSLWRRKYGASPDVLGKPLALNGVSYTIVGVLSADFTFYGQDRDVYTLIGQWNDSSFRDRSITVSARAFGCLRSGVTVAQAQADMDLVSRSLAAAFPIADKEVGVSVISMKDDIVGGVRPLLLLLLGAVGFLLLIACANVANLLLARSTGRSHELAIRAAIGAGRGRLIRQLIVESLLLSFLGGTLGILFALAGVDLVLSALPRVLPRAREVSLDGSVLLFTSGTLLLATLVFGLAPALKGSRINLVDALKEGGRGATASRHRVQGVFVATEVGLALVLLVGAGLMVQSLSALWRVNPGYTPHHAITFSVSIPSTTVTTSAETRARLRRLDEMLAAIPGVEAVSVTLGSRPLIHDSSLPFWIDGQPRPSNDNEMPQAVFYLVEAGFQRAMGMTLLQGRFVSLTDDERAPKVIDIDDRFARAYFPHQNPVGKRVHLQQFNVEAEIVGVVGHLKQWGPAPEPSSVIAAQFFYPFMQLPEKVLSLAAGGVAVVMRTAGDPAALPDLIRSAVKRHDAGEVVYNVETLEQGIAASLAPRRITMILLAVFAGLAVVLASVGIYGVISYLVGQRTHEIGIRVALGAQQRDVMRLVLGEGARMAVAGVVCGMAIAWVLTRFMESELFGIAAHDPLTYAVVAAFLMCIALLACYLPARRAIRIHPMSALRRG